MGFIGIVTLLTKSFQLNRTTANDTQATYLASEGIEIAKNLIDHDVYAGFALSANTNDFGACFPLAGYYYPIDYSTTDCSTLHFSPPSSPPNTVLYLDPSTHLFGEDSSVGSATSFTRNIEVTPISNSSGLAELDVQSTVTWTEGLTSNTITLEDHFYNWHP